MIVFSNYTQTSTTSDLRRLGFCWTRKEETNANNKPSGFRRGVRLASSMYRQMCSEYHDPSGFSPTGRLTCQLDVVIIYHVVGKRRKNVVLCLQPLGGVVEVDRGGRWRWSQGEEENLRRSHRHQQHYLL